MNWQIIVGVILALGGIANIFNEFGAFLFGLAGGCALIFWGLKKKGILRKKETSGTRQLMEETFQAVGESYYENNIRKLAYPNPKWARPATVVVEEGDAGKRIFKHYYGNKPVELKPENNPHDKNAVAVYIAGELVGYISREENLHVRDILKNREIISVSSFIGGGDYKVVSETFDTISGELGFSVAVRIKYI